MTTAPCPLKTTTFFQLLENTPQLDGRDNRGKRHSLALVLTGLVAALCCGRDGSLSRLHRHMTNQFGTLLLATQLTDQKPISRAQLPLLLAKVNGFHFTRLLFDWFGFVLDDEQKQCGAARAVFSGWEGTTRQYPDWPYAGGSSSVSSGSPAWTDCRSDVLLWGQRK